MQTIPATPEPAIWKRLLRNINAFLTIDAAQSLLQLGFDKDDKDRMRYLAAKARDGSLTEAEQEEISCHERVGNLLALLKSKARMRLRRGGV